MKTAKMLFLITLVAISGFSCSLSPIKEESDFIAIYEKAEYLAHLLVKMEYEEDVYYFVDGAWIARKETKISESRLSGFVISQNDQFYILTAGHIRSDDFKILKITAYFKYSVSPQEMEILGYNMIVDGALLKFKDEKFRFSGQPAKLGQSAKLKPLESVMAIGSQFGDYRYTPTRGYIANIIFTQQPERPTLILHTAIINPGNSGGPLINGKGEVIGMNVMMRGDASNTMATTLSAAVPIDYLITILPDLEKGVKIDRK